MILDLWKCSVHTHLILFIDSLIYQPNQYVLSKSMLELVFYLHFDISHMKGSDIAQSLSFNAKLMTE